MPPIETSDRWDKALLWTKAGYDNYGNYTRSSDYTEIDVRWEEERGETLDSNGNVVAYDVRCVVAQEIAIGSIMWKGDEDAYTEAAGTVGTADNTIDFMIVIQRSHIEDIKGRNIRRVVYLIRYKDDLPST